MTATALSYDEGLRGYMLKVYNWMTLGLLVTAGVAWGMFTTGAIATVLASSVLTWTVMLAPLAIVFTMPFVGRDPMTAGAMFLLLAAFLGASTSTIFLQYSIASIFTTFLATSAAFAGLSLFGYTTKINMSGLGSFFLMALIGLLVLMVINIFVASSALALAISSAGVLLFAGLTAYDTQKIKDGYVTGFGNEVTAIYSALELYLDFLNMFLFLLRFLGVAKSD